ncbi:hypothetical protein IAI18_11985 [Acetobacteraceae bacterium H6797]|nr:hypothetical protein [Acetobacteraceae bacterium H6797]
MLVAGKARFFRLAALLPALAYLLVVLSPPLNHDVSAVLNFSERWLAGEDLYTDLIDVNPPLIFVLNLLPAWIADHTPLDGPRALQLCLLALAGVVWAMSARIRRGRNEGPVEAAVLSAVVPLYLVIAGYDFGQREHIMACAALPYFLLAARRVEGQPTRWPLLLSSTILAGLGFALKPHFLAIPAFVELVVLLERQRLAGHGVSRLETLARSIVDPVPWLLAAVWAAYLASIFIFFDDYFGYVVPLVWDYYLDNGNLNRFSVLVSDDMGPMVLLMLVLVPASLRLRAGALSRILAAALLGAFLSAWVQHKGWTYHVLPMLMIGTLLACVLAARFADDALPPARGRLSAPLLGLAAAAMVAVYGVRGGEAPWREIGWDGSRAERLTEMLQQEAYGERLLVLSPDIFPVYPAINYATAQSTLRTMNLWLLEGTNRTCPANGARYHETWEMSRAEFFVYRTVAEDFAEAPPAAVLVSTNPGIPWCGKEFDFIEYFSRHPLFADTWTRYRLKGEIEGYKLYVRED